MSNKERENFLHGAISRAPGKRQIKPTTIATGEEFVLHDDDDSDEEFVAPPSSADGNDSDEDESGESSEEGDDNEGDDTERASTATDNAEMQATGGTRPEKPEPLVCSICLNMRNIEDDLIIQCDKCGVCVHESCYAVMDPEDDQASVVSNFSTDPWFCEPCLFDLEKPPHCELCPNQYGAFKRADVGGKWVHLTCALYTPGISFGDVENLSAVSWQEIDYKRFGRKPCEACTNVLEARTGITTPCEAGLCKNHYHITCAQKLGLLVDAASEELHNFGDKHVDPHFLLCRTHNAPEVVTKKRHNYAIFMRQEQKRLAILNRRLLDQRESFKLARQRKQYDERIKTFNNVTIHLPAVHNKRQRLVQTSPDFLEAFTEKAELFGIPPQDFMDAFTRLPPAQISYLAPAFSVEFVKYFENRENNVFNDERKRLHEGECELKKVEQAEKDLNLMLEKLTANEVPRSVKQKSPFELRFTALCEQLNISMEEEEDDNGDAKEVKEKRPLNTDDSKKKPAPKAHKVEEPPTKKRRPSASESAKESNKKASPPAPPSKTNAQCAVANAHSVKNAKLRNARADRASSLASGSVDTNIEPELDVLPESGESSDGPPVLRSANELRNSVESSNVYTDEDERPTLLPMISADENTKTKKRPNSKNSRAKRVV